jgi:hypothetical protein
MSVSPWHGVKQKESLLQKMFGECCGAGANADGENAEPQYFLRFSSLAGAYTRPLFGST